METEIEKLEAEVSGLREEVQTIRIDLARGYREVDGHRLSPEEFTEWRSRAKLALMYRERDLASARAELKAMRREEGERKQSRIPKVLGLIKEIETLTNDDQILSLVREAKEVLK